MKADIPTTGDDRVRFHDLRHDFASNLLRKSRSANGMKVLQELLGHSKITTTMGTYAHVTIDEKAAAMEDVAGAQVSKSDKNHRSGHRSRKLRAV